MNRIYVHGYDRLEAVRLQHQAQTLEELLHSDTSFPAGSSVLEAGCGIGAQTIPLARNSPGARIISVDVSADSLAAVFVCFVLEHLADPIHALTTLKKLLRPGGTITVIEGDHGSAYFHPDSEAAQMAIRCLVELQRAAGGDALIGRQLYPLLRQAGFDAVRVSPRLVYVDSSRPDLVAGFTRNTFTAMIEGVREPAVRAGMATPELFDAGISALYRSAETDGVFCYTFFKALGEKDAVRATSRPGPLGSRPREGRR
jgi:SAM-dependent methyltransferase